VRTCRIEPQALSQAQQWIAERKAIWESQLDRLGAYLAGQPGKPETGDQP
jgi:hypothetical protein